MEYTAESINVLKGLEAKHRCMLANHVIILTEDCLSIEKIQEKLNGNN